MIDRAADTTGVTDETPFQEEEPWLGLHAYTEADSGRFFGRTEEIAALKERILDNIQTTVFGPSGIGKTSLLCAGVFPRLRQAGAVPVYIRLEHAPSDPPYRDQIVSAVKKALDHEQIDTAELAGPLGQSENESLWTWFHRHEFWDTRNHLVAPVLVIDQFEELFTLGTARPDAASIVTELGNLCSNTVPTALEQHLQATGEHLGYSITTQRYRVVLSLREDFLARLEELTEAWPVFSRNRVSVQAMSIEQAMEVVLMPGRQWIDAGVARAIVDAVTCREKARSGRNTPSSVEPALLSLFCQRLNRRRRDLGMPVITLEDVEQSREDILQSFYDESMATVSPKTREFVEDNLITGTGYRSAKPLDDVKGAGISKDELDALIGCRLLRYDSRQKLDWVEFSHDILTPLARKSREQRHGKQALEKERRESARLRAERDKQKRRTRLAVAFSGALVITISVAALLFWFCFLKEHRTYYENFKKVYGIPQGLNRLTKEQVSHRLSSFELTTTGLWTIRIVKAPWPFKLELARVTKMRAVNRRCRPTTNHNVGTYLWRHRPFLGDEPAAIFFERGGELGNAGAPKEERVISVDRLAAVCEWEYLTGQDGRPACEIGRDGDGQVVWAATYAPTNGDEWKRSATVHYVDERGYPLRQRKDEAEYVVIRYAENGLEEYHEYHDAQGNPVTGLDGCWAHKTTFDAEGRQIAVQALQWIAGTGYAEAMTGRSGYSQVCYSYDEQGRCVEIVHLDMKGRRASVQNGHAIERRAYDEWGNRKEQAWFNIHDQPEIDEEYGAHRLGFAYRARRQIEEIRYFDRDGAPCLGSGVFFGVKVRYDDFDRITEFTSIGKSGRPIAIFGGPAIARRKYDEKGNEAELAYFGEDGDPAALAAGFAVERQEYDVAGNMTRWACFDVEGRPVLSSEGYAIVSRKYDERGNQIEWACFDTEEEPVLHALDGLHLSRWVWDGAGRVVEERYFGVEGNPVALKSGYAIERMKYDQMGNECECAFFDVNDQSTVDVSTGIHRTCKTYNDVGNVVEERYFGVDGNAAASKNGYAIERIVYDNSQNEIMRAFFDSNGRPAIDLSAGMHITCKTYNEAGNVLEECYFGVDGKPIVLESGYASKRMQYDDREDEVECAFFDANDQPALDKVVGAHRICRTYDGGGRVVEERYFGVDGDLVAVKDGYSFFRRKYDDWGNEIEWACFDAQGQPVVNASDNTHMVRNTYNESGQLTATYCFGINGEPCLHAAGNHGYRVHYGNQGREAEYTLLGLDDKPIAIEYGYAITRSKYDENGNEVECSFFDMDGDPVLDRLSNAHMMRKSYDAAGNVLEERYFGVNDTPIMSNEGGAILRMKYDPRGHEIERAFFDENDKPVSDRLLGAHMIRRAYDAAGRIVEECYFGKDGALIAEAGDYAIVRMQYDGQGNEIERAFFGKDAEPVECGLPPVHMTRTAYNEGGRAVEIRYFGKEGTLTTVNRGYAIERMKCDEKGNEVEHAFFDEEDEPAEGGMPRSHMTCAAYNEAGKVIERRYFGKDGMLTTVGLGYAIERMAYDEQGNLIEHAFFDKEDKPAEGQLLGMHIARTTYDDAGRIVEIRYFARDGALVCVGKGYAIERMKYDEQGNLIEHAFFDNYDKPVINDLTGIHMTRSTYNEAGKAVEISYFGKEGALIAVDRGHAIERMKYDEKGNEIERAFFDNEGKPAEGGVDGVHMTRRTYDEGGLLAEERYFGKDGAPRALGDGKCGWRAKRDDQGLETEYVFLGADGEPVALEYGYAIRRTKYDEQGNEIECAYFDAKGQPAVDTLDGTHMIRRTYNGAGQIAAEHYFGVDGQPCQSKAGYASVVYTYDELGELSTEKYFDLKGQEISVEPSTAEVEGPPEIAAETAQ